MAGELEVIPLCRLEDKTCGACCWGRDVDRGRLETALARHAALFPSQHSGETLPSGFGLVWHELRVRRGLDLLWMVLLLIPGAASLLRKHLARHAICAFAAFEDDQESRVGCLLHPSRKAGIDKRSRHAYFLLSGVSCGGSDYLCGACDTYSRRDEGGKAVFRERNQQSDWFEYSQRVSQLGAGVEPPATGLVAFRSQSGLAGSRKSPEK